MAIQNLSRTHGKHKKRDISVALVEIDVSGEYATSADTYQLVQFAHKTLILGVTALVLVPNDAVTSAVADIGIDGDNSLVSAGDLTDTAGTDLASMSAPFYLETGGVLTYIPTYTGAMTEGKILLAVQYVETDRTNGQMTAFIDD